MAADLDREPLPAAGLTDHIDGVVMLGGGVDGGKSAVWQQIALNEAAERVTALQELARRYPDARLVVSGGIGRLIEGPGQPARALEAYYARQALDPARILFEDRSRNTYENAVLTRQRVQPAPGECWLLVTSAYHMPRAVGVFRQAGWPVTAYPVDYRTMRSVDLPMLLGRLAQPEVAERLIELDLAIKAWLGLMVYRLTGRTDALFAVP